MLSNDGVSRILKQLRGSVSNKEFCKKAGFNEGSFGRWINGESKISLLDFSRVCDTAGIPLSQALDFDDNDKLPLHVQIALISLREEMIRLWKDTSSPDDAQIIELFTQHARNLLPLFSSLQLKQESKYLPPKESSVSKEPIAFEFSTELDEKLDLLSWVDDPKYQTPQYSGATAGHGGVIEEAAALQRPGYLKGYQNDNSIHLHEISGESMQPTIDDGSLVAIKRFESPLILGDEGHVPLSRFNRLIPHDTLVLLDHNETGATVKRICYRGSDSGWGLFICPDNPEWDCKLLRKGERLCVYGLVMGQLSPS